MSGQQAKIVVVADRPRTHDSAAKLLAEQRTYYDLRAPDYGVETRPPDRLAHGSMDLADVQAVVNELQPAGDVLELACGPGGFTQELVRYADTLTAVDASTRMLARNREQVGDPTVEYVRADLFDWDPTGQFDVVFFGFWLSHVPPDAFDAFWALVEKCLRPGGRVAFVDEDDRGAYLDESRVIDGVPAARRTLADGRQFDIVKLFWEPAALEERLRALGWDIAVRAVGETFLYGFGRLAGRAG